MVRTGERETRLLEVVKVIFEGVRSGEAGVIATLAENPSQLERMAQASAGGRARTGSRSCTGRPVDLYVDQWVYELLETIERTGTRRVLIDSLTNDEYATGDPIRFSEYVYSLTLRCSRSGVSLLMTMDPSCLPRQRSPTRASLSSRRTSS